MTEQDVNTAIIKSLVWGYKIPDPGKHDVYRTSKRPFDGFGITATGVPLYYEAKLVKGYKAMSFDRIEPHQWTNLKEISGSAIDAYCLILVAIHKERGTDLFLFDVWYLDKLRQTKKSITKADFLAYVKAGKYVTMYKGQFPLADIAGKIITEEVKQ